MIERLRNGYGRLPCQTDTARIFKPSLHSIDVKDGLTIYGLPIIFSSRLSLLFVSRLVHRASS